MNKLLYIVLFIFFTIFSIKSQTTLKIELLKGSITTIDGSAGLIKFRIYQEAENFLKKNYIVNLLKQQNRISFDINNVNIPVKLYNSSNKMALRDFLKMMEPENYKTMDIDLNYIEIPSDINKNHTGNAVLNFKIKGVSKKYTMPIHYSKQGEVYTFDSSKQINIRDFGLEPPKAMMGLVKTSEIIDIGLHFVLKISSVEQLHTQK